MATSTIWKRPAGLRFAMRVKRTDTRALRRTPAEAARLNREPLAPATNPDASSLPPNAADPATSRPPAPKTAMSQSPLDLRRAFTSPRTGARVRKMSRPAFEATMSR